MADTVNNRQNWLFDKCKGFNDPERQKRFHVVNMLNRTTQMFKYIGLPDTIATKDLETLLQVNGYAIWATDDKTGKLYVFGGGLGGEPNPYYLPTKAIIANPALRLNKTLEIDTDCVVMLNDHYYVGLMPLFEKYSDLLTTAEITLKFALTNARIPALVQADNDNTKADAEVFLKKVVDGKEFGVIGTNDFFKGLQTYPFAGSGASGTIKDTIEAIQYLRGTWYNEIGLNAAFNMKREAINESEATLNDNILFPPVDTMLEMRKSALEKVNGMFGTNITVEFNSSWAYNEDMEELAVEQAEVEAQGGEDVEQNEVEANADSGADDITT